MTRCTECNEYPAGTVCSYSGCPGKQYRPRTPYTSTGTGEGQGHAPEGTNDGGTSGDIARRECMATVPPILDDGEGWPFHLCRTPYRPADFADWRDGLADRFDLHFFALDQSGQVVPHDNRAVPHTDGIATKS